jgi:hypothetical protein
MFVYINLFFIHLHADRKFLFNMKKIFFSLFLVVALVSCKKSVDATIGLSEFGEIEVNTVDEYNKYHILKSEIKISPNSTISEYGFVYSYSHPVFNEIFSDSLRILYTFNGNGNQTQSFEDTIFHLGLAVDYAIKPYATNAGRISFGKETKLSGAGANIQKIAAPAFADGAINAFGLSNGSVAIVGGGSGNRLFSKLDGNTLEFSSIADTLPIDFANELCTTFSLGNFGYVIGGQLNGVPSNQVYRYDFTANTWTKMQDFPGGARMSAIAAVVDNKAYVGFGTDNNTNYADLWEYNEATDSWNKKNISDPNIKGRNGSSCFVIGKSLYIVGGNSSPSIVNQTHSANFWQYNTQDNIWNVLSDCPFNTGRSVGYTQHNEGYIGFGAISKYNNIIVGYNDKNQKWFGYYDGSNGSLGSSNKVFSLLLNEKLYVANFETNEIMRIK